MLYPDIAAREAGFLPVSGGHSLYWERSGREGGRALIFLHGGPGSGANIRNRRYTDPAIWETIQFDQRGCGRSAPLFELTSNTTADLVGDIEALRVHLGLERFDCVAGASWGSTLALAYAQAHPERVGALMVEGVFLATRKELDWGHSPQGAGAIFPDALEILMEGVPAALQSDPAAFARWALEEMQTELAAGAPHLAGLADPSREHELADSLIYRWTAYEELISHMEARPADILAASRTRGRDGVIAHSLLEAHYFAHDCFLAEDQIIENAHRLTMPVHILHSRYDMVCPFEAPWRLHKAIAHSRLTEIPGHGHAMSEPVLKALVEAIAAL